MVEFDVSKFKLVYVMFSGGKDSLTTLHLMRKYSNVRALFIDTGIATPGMRDYIIDVCRKLGVEADIISTKYDFFSLVLTNGFPIMKYRWCKHYLKIHPLREFVKKLIDEYSVEGTALVTGVRASESWMKSRTVKLYKHPELYGIQVYAVIHEWSEEDVYTYLTKNDLTKYVKDSKLLKDCWCTPYKTPSDYALLAIHYPQFFRKFVETERKLNEHRKRDKPIAGLWIKGKPIYFSEIAENPHKFLENAKFSEPCEANCLICSGCKLSKDVSSSVN